MLLPGEVVTLLSRPAFKGVQATGLDAYAQTILHTKWHGRNPVEGGPKCLRNKPINVHIRNAIACEEPGRTISYKHIFEILP